jgi:hypothetical protein
MAKNYRRCVSCRQVAHKSAFWRIVKVHPSHQLQLDWGIGRSAYLCPQTSCLEGAKKKNRLGRSLKANVPEEIYQKLWQRLGDERYTAKPWPQANMKDENQQPKTN